MLLSNHRQTTAKKASKSQKNEVLISYLHEFVKLRYKKKINLFNFDLARKSARKRSSRQNSERSNESSPSPSLSAGSSKITPVRRLSRAFARLLSFRRNSESAIKKNIIRFESDDEAQDDQSQLAARVSRNSQRRHTGKEFFSNLNYKEKFTWLIALAITYRTNNYFY